MKISWGLNKQKIVKSKKLNKEKPKGGKKFKLNIKGVNTIVGKLIISYVVPIILIVVLGIISYRKAADTIIANYENSMENTIQKTAEYYGLMMDTLATNCNQIAIDNTLQSYYRGVYKNDPLQEKKNFQEIKKSMFKNAFSGDFVNGIYAFGEYGSASVSYSDVKKLEYGAYAESEEGTQMTGMKENILYAGYHNDLDAQTGHTSDEYAFCVKRNITNKSAKPIGVIVMDISMDAAKEPLLQMDLGEGTTCALISSDGRQISDLEEENEISFVTMEAYQNFIAGEESSKADYMKYNGKNYLFLFSKVGDTGFTVCTMIPRALITSRLKDIQTATVIIVIIALLISGCTAAVISAGMNSSIKNISKVMKSVAEGDLTVSVHVKGKDEFKKLGDHAGDMLANT